MFQNLKSKLHVRQWAVEQVALLAPKTVSAMNCDTFIAESKKLADYIIGDADMPEYVADIDPAALSLLLAKNLLPSFAQPKEPTERGNKAAETTAAAE